MANLVPKVNNSGTIGTTAKKWANIHATTITPSAQASDLSLNSQKITNLAAPVASTDAATKAYVDSEVSAAVQGLSAKDAVRVATTASGTLASAFANGQSIDGVTLATGDRILIKDQSTGSENGIYTVNASGAPTRAVDFDANAEVAKGAYVFVEEGTANADAGFVLTTDGAITLGTTSLSFTQFSGAGQITAGSGLSKSGNTLSVDSTLITDKSVETSIADDDLVLFSDTSSSNALKKITKANFISGLGALSNVVEDTTPQLGGSLDVNGQDIVSTSNGNITVTPNGSGVFRVDGTSGIDMESGSISVKNSGSVSNIKLYCEVGNAHYTQLQSAAHGSYSGNVTLTLPTSTGTLVGSGDSGTVTNTMLAGSIANAKLSNSAVTVTAGNGLSGGGSVALGASTSLALDLNELTAAVVDVANDSIVIVDANDSNASKKESVADLVAGVAGTGLSASSGQLSIDGTVTTLAGSQTLTNKTLTSPVLNTGVSGTAVLDEDDMSSNSATKLATQQSIKAYVDAQVAGGGLNIDGYSALGGTGLHQTQDHFVFSDNGTEKKITFSNLEDAIFANISGDATIAAGGALTIGANAVEGSMLNNNTISGQTEMTGDVADDDELMISDAGTLKRADFSVVRDAVFNDVSGDATIAAGGALTIAAASVENSMLAGSITASKLNNAIFADLETLGAPASDGQFIVATGAGAFSYESADTARTSLGLGTGNSPTFTSLTLSGQAGALAMNSQKITGLATPTADGDAATKSYVDSVAQGLSAKDAVRVATTANGTLASAFANGQTVDGITLATGDRILIKDQSTGSENGIYTVNASGAPTRAVDFDANAEVAKGAYFFVEEGTTNADAGFVLTTDGAITLGTTSLSFTQFSGAGDITAGSALTKSGNTLNVAVDDSSIEVSSDALRVKASGITSAMLAGSIANSKLNTITTANKVALSSLDLDGGTDIGADLADADLVVVDDGAGGTNRKAALSRMKKYIYSSISGDATASDSGALTIASGAVETAMVNANVITGQTAETSIHDDDLVLIYDDSASALRKMTKANFVSGLSGGAAADDITTGDAAVTLATSSGNITIDAQGSDTDIIFKGTDGSSDTTFLTLDGSDAGTAIFNHDIKLDSDGATIFFGDDQDIKLVHEHDQGLVIQRTTGSSFYPELTIRSDENGNHSWGALKFESWSASPATNDFIMKIEAAGGDSTNPAAPNTSYISMLGKITDVTNGSESGSLEFNVASGGTVAGNGSAALEMYGNSSGHVITKLAAHNGSNSGLMLGSTLVTSTAAELNKLDGVTGGTVTASKALVVDANKDLGTIRNLTIDGTFSDGNYTFDTSGNVSGLGTVGCGAITSTGTSTFAGGITPAAADGAALGSASAEWSDLYLALGGKILFGNNQKVTVTHEENKGLIFKNENVGDDNPFILTLQTGETDIQSDDVIGKLDFQAPDEGTGTDAILVCAGIEAVSEGDFSSSNNATKLSFKTAASEAAAEKMSLSSTGNLKILGDLILDDGGSIKEAGGTAALTIDASGNVTKIGQDSPSSGQFLKWDGSKAVWDAASGGGGGGFTYSAVSSATTAAAQYHYSVTGTTTITLPAASGVTAGKEVRVKNMGSNTVTIARSSSDTIDGQTSISMAIQYQALSFISNGSDGWEII